MPTEIHRKLLVSVADLAFGTSWANLDSLADGDIAWSAPVTGLGSSDLVEVFASIKVGTSPTDGGLIKFYAGGGDDAGIELRVGTDDISTTASGTETVDADVARVLGALGPPVFQVRVDSTTGKVYTARFSIPDPGDDFQLFVYNDTGVAFDGSGSPHKVHYRGWGWQSQ